MTSTTNVSDSYNETTNRVANLSNVGNVHLSFQPEAGALDKLPEISTLLPFAVVGIVGVLALFLIKK